MYMDIQQILTQPQYVRVVDSTYGTSTKAKTLIGKEVEIRRDYHDNTVCIWDEGKNIWWFNLSDVVFLSPLTVEGKKVGIGDWIERDGRKYLVYGWHWHDGWWVLDTAIEGDFTHCWSCDQRELNNFTFVTTEEDMIEIDGKKWRKGTIKEALKQYAN